jgi:hypothetical protein
MPNIDVEAVAADLAKTAAALKRHIAEEAQRKAAELGKTYAKAADERIRDNAVDLQRATDLAAELRRQLNARERQAVAGFALEKRIREMAGIARSNGDKALSDALLDVIATAHAAGRAATQPAPAMESSHD